MCMLDLFIGNPSLLPIRLFMLFVFTYGFSERFRNAVGLVAKFVLKVCERSILGVWWVIKYPVYVALWIGMNVIFPLTFLVGIGMMLLFVLPILSYALFEAVITLSSIFLFGEV